MQLAQAHLFLNFLHGPWCLAEWTYLEFQLMARVSMSMATRSSNLYSQKSGVNNQTEGHTLTPPSGWNGPEETGAFGNTTSHWPSKSLVRKQMPDCCETQYCLEIQVTLTEDGEIAPPPPHAWQAPVVEDMLRDGKLGLTEVVVTGPVGPSSSTEGNP